MRSPLLLRSPRVLGISALLLAWIGAAAARASDVRLLATDPGTIRFAIDVPEPRLEPLPEDSRFSVLSLDGYEPDGTPGDVALPVRVVTVAVPPTGPVQVVARAEGFETKEARLALLGRPGAGESRASEVGGRVWMGAEAERGTSTTSRGLARLIGVSWMRDQRVARVAISPARYDRAERRLTLARRIEVDVRVSGDEGGSAVSARPADPFEPIYDQTLVNPEQGRAWRVAPSTRAGSSSPALALARGQEPSRAEVIDVPDTSLYAGRVWVKIAIPRTGFYKVDFGQVRNSRLFHGRTNVPLDSLRLFTWPGVPVLPETTYCDSCGYREVAIQLVAGTNNNLFDVNSEFFYFYALGPSDWTDLYVGPQDPRQPDSVFLNHPYETRNWYYLTLDDAAHPLPGPPRRMSAPSAAPVDTLAASVPLTFRERVHFEKDREWRPEASPIYGENIDGTYVRLAEFWEKWFWTSINNTSFSPFRQTFSLPGIESPLPARLRVRLWGLSRLIGGVSKTVGVADHYVDARLGSTVFDRAAWDGLLPATLDTTVAGLDSTGNELTLEVVRNADPPFPGRVDQVGVAWFDVFYRRRFEPVSNVLSFGTDPAGGSEVYRIGPFTAPPDSLPLVFDVSDPYAPLQLTGIEYLGESPGRFFMRFQPVASGPRRYWIVPQSAIDHLVNSDVIDASSVSATNLRNAQRADYLVIYYDGFRSAADTLLSWRREHLPWPGRTSFETYSTPISAIYDQFSGGRTDPAAIRNFLRAAFFNWDLRPTFVTLLGDASYDFKDIRGQAQPGQPATLLPTYEGGYDRIVERQYATDDWMLNVDDAVRVVPDFFGGRIPAADATSALGYVRDKLIFYERSAPLGEWRNRIMLIADDDQVDDRRDPLGWSHLRQTAALDLQAMPPEIDRAYVYLHTYPDDPSGTTKLGVKDDIVHNFEQGVVLANYVGHGSPSQLSDESVFLTHDAEALTNRDKPSFLIAASCDVGKYDDPTTKSMGERLVLELGGGTVGVVSATELAYSNINAELNQALFGELFRRDPGTGRYETPVAQALLVAKTGSVNNQKYQLMGDSGLRLAFPRLSLDVTAENTDGTPITQIARGQTVVVKGRLLDRPGGSPVALEGRARLAFEDSAPIDTACFVFCSTSPTGETICSRDCASYRFRASPMFRGDVSVRSGSFEQKFIVPMDARLGPRGRTRAYAELESGTGPIDGSGSDSVALVQGVADLADREGPRILLGFVGGASRVRPDATLRVDLYDASGILITGNSPQNGILVTIDDNTSLRSDITASFRYAADSYQSGTAFFRLPGLAPGTHRIRVSAADNLAAGLGAAEHRSSATIEFEVTSAPPLQVTRAILFPNPVRSGARGSGGQFVIDAPGDSVTATLRIYTVSGRAIRTLHSEGSLAQVQIPWDGLDAEGEPLARGVYFFKVQVYPRLAGGGSGGSQRAEADGRFVVVGR